MHNRRDYDHVIRYKLSGSLAYLPAKTDIRVYRQMGAVVLNGGDGYKGHSIFLGNVTNLRPRHLTVKEFIDH